MTDDERKALLAMPAVRELVRELAAAVESLDVEFDGSARSWGDGAAAARRQAAECVRARGRP